jgi:hypothetical protein
VGTSEVTTGQSKKDPRENYPGERESKPDCQAQKEVIVVH